MIDAIIECSARHRFIVFLPVAVSTSCGLTNAIWKGHFGLGRELALVLVPPFPAQGELS